MNLDKEKWISGLCYISIVFAPLFFPILVLYFSNNDTIKHHAKLSLPSHFIPIFTWILIVSTIVRLEFQFPMLIIASCILVLLINVMILTRNIFKGVLIIKGEQK